MVDAWIGNFDRHGANWGFLKKDNRYRIAPIYDNGSSLFPKLNTDDKLQRILESEEEMNKRIYQFPTSQILLDKRKSSYYEVINSLQFAECNAAVCRLYHRIDMDWVERFINETPGLSDIRKKFYITMLDKRYEKMIREPYLKLCKE